VGSARPFRRRSPGTVDYFPKKCRLSKSREGQVSRSTVYQLCERGELAHVRVSSAIRVPVAAVAAYVLVRRASSRSAIRRHAPAARASLISSGWASVPRRTSRMGGERGPVRSPIGSSSRALPPLTETISPSSSTPSA